ncbi:hypothetical protein D515_03205 [Grimontia indica]|uniref:PNPLA domain-containing protein n=1 Tax=Grimontia indica TaxID=1056512 RepID=R1IKS1_9GAMM|nr:patatin-like phospholipase family protein [Grimontia indica]EOD78082.1 hypothetical protein D515_03205 [Grimontia indica]
MIESYAVFEGGGVKGAAFAGALKAAEESRIKFVGYGGASAGAIVAFLAALGFNSDEIKERMSNLDFIKLLDSPIDGEANRIKETIASLKSESKLILILKVINALRRNRSFISRIIKNNGAFRKRNIISLLAVYAYEKYPKELSVNEAEDELTISFEKFHELTGVDFRVVATDVISGEAKEFSSTETAGDCVFEAIAASAAYPIVFEPTNNKNTCLVDGGLSCNLPTYLFHREIHKKIPIYAFDLISENVRSECDRSFGSHLKGLLNSALDATTNILSQIVGGIAVPVIVPSDIGTLDFDLSKSDIDRMYYSGYASAKAFFQNHRLTRLGNKVSSASDVATLLYGNNFNFILNLLIDSLPSLGKDVKAWLYTCPSASENRLISFAKESNSNIAPNDHEFEFSEVDKDCVASWVQGSVVWSYDFNNGKTRICFPITTIDLLSIDDDLESIVGSELLALLCISMDVHYTDCPWLERRNYVVADERAYDIAGDIDTILHHFCYTIRNSMLGHQTSFHQFKGISDA